MTPLRYTIRPALPSDAAGLARVRIDTWRAAYRGIIPDAYLASLDYSAEEQRFRNYLANPETWIFTALDEARQVVGFASCSASRDALPGFPGEVYAIYILPAYHKHGIGRNLLRAAFAQLLVRGLFPAAIWALEANPACDFYRRLGGIEIARKQLEIGGKALSELGFGFTESKIEN